MKDTIVKDFSVKPSAWGVKKSGIVIGATTYVPEVWLDLTVEGGPSVGHDLTPKKARKLAKALLKAADLAEYAE